MSIPNTPTGLKPKEKRLVGIHIPPNNPSQKAPRRKPASRSPSWKPDLFLSGAWFSRVNW